LLQEVVGTNGKEFFHRDDDADDKMLSGSPSGIAAKLSLQPAEQNTTSDKDVPDSPTNKKATKP
jgi:hypothetical protein